MNHDTASERRRGRRLRAFGVMTAVSAVAALGACDADNLITLPDPDLITIETIRDTANLGSLLAGATFEFQRAVAGPAGNNQTPGYIGISGLLTDEMWYSSTFGTMQDIDERDHRDTNGSVDAVYTWLHRARNLTNEVAKRFADSDRANTEEHAALVNMRAFTFLYFAEGWCSGVPISAAPLGEALEFGAQETTDELFQRAIASFDEALSIAQSAGSSQEMNVALVGKARAQLGLGDIGGAASTVASVPPDFVDEVTYSEVSTSPNNGLWWNINIESRSSIASGDGENGIEFFAFDNADPPTAAQTDPRAPIGDVGIGLGTEVPLIEQGKYTSRGADVVVASGLEARLIQAEAMLDGGQSDSYLTVINPLRASVELDPLSDPGTPDARVLQLFEERAFWLWLTGHRLGDLRRLVRHYGFDQAEVFPTGPTIFETLRGDDVNFIIPEEERNNPEFTGACLSREA